MAYGKQHPGPQTPTVPAKKGAKAIRLQADDVAADLLGDWLDIVHGNTTWSTRGNGTYVAGEK